MYKKTGKRWVEYRDPIDLMGHPSDMQTMIREDWQLVTNELVEFDKEPIEVQNCKKFINHFRGFYRIYPNLIKENQSMSTCKWLDLQTLGSQPVMPKNLPNHMG